jgi:uncharacterized phage-associated protein
MLSPQSAAALLLKEAEIAGLSLSNLQLQKLLYLAHGVHLARYGRPLINERFQAWRYGPVNENLYHQLKYFGASPVPPDHPVVADLEHFSCDDDARRSIADVVAAFGNLTAQKLVAITHDPSGPWRSVYQDGTGQIEIADESIQKYFRSRLSNSR